MLGRRSVLAGAAAALPGVAYADCGEERRRKLLRFGEWLVPGAEACGTGQPVFFDTFNTLSLYNTRNTAAGGTWQPAGTFSTFVDGQDLNQVWVVNPFNPATPYNNVYTVANSVLSMRIDNSPNSANTGGDALIGGRLHTFNTFQHLVQGYWEINIAVPLLAGSLFSFWLNDPTGAQQINISEVVGFPDGSHFSGFAVWNPATLTVANSWYTYQMASPVDTTGFHSYGVEVTASQVGVYVDRVLQVTFPLPAGYVNPMFIFMDWCSGGPPQGNGFISAPVAQAFLAQVAQVGYWTARPF